MNYSVALIAALVCGSAAAKSTQDCEAEVGSNDRAAVAKCLADAVTQRKEPAGAVFTISNASITDLNSVGGVDISVRITNTFDKPIKYVNITTRVFNAVADDVSYNAIGQRQPGRLSVTGPIAPGETDTYHWETVWYSPTAKCVRIESVTVIFMNNTRLSMAANDKRIMNNKCR